MRDERSNRYSTGIPDLDDALGGGLIPGTLTVLVGATGIGKTQLGMQFLQAGQSQEGKPGIILDMTPRGDSQSHAEYVRRLFGRSLAPCPDDAALDLLNFFSPGRTFGDILHTFAYRGRRVTRHDLDFDNWQLWQAELVRVLPRVLAFLYGNFGHGVRRLVLDGVEPAGKTSDSIQLDLCEYIYEQVIRKECDWVARDLFRQHFRDMQPQVESRPYSKEQLSGMLLWTSAENMLDELLARPLGEGDLLTNANTVLLMGRIAGKEAWGRGLAIAKHRGSAASDRIFPFATTDRGLELRTS